MDEKEAILRIKDSDSEAFNFLYKCYWRKVYHFAKLYLINETDAKEVVQEVFIRLWEKRETLDADRDLDGYLFIITRNLIFSHSREKLNMSFYRATVARAAKESYSIEEEFQAADLQEYIYSLVEMLPARQREIFLLSRKKHLTYKEMAEQLQISEKTVEYHMSEALKFLKKNLQMYMLFVF